MASLSNIQGILVNDPTKIINTPRNSTTQTGQGLWSQIQPGSTGPFNTPYTDSYESRLLDLANQVQAQELTIKLLRLKLLAFEGKFTQEEVANIRKMIMSEDEASRTLADSIIENA